MKILYISYPSYHVSKKGIVQIVEIFSVRAEVQ